MPEANRFFMLGTMKKYFLYTFTLGLLSVACLPTSREKETAATTEVPDKKKLKTELLERLSILSNMSKLKYALAEADLTAREIVDFCRKNEDMYLRAKLIQAVFSDNSYQEEAPKQNYWAAHRLHVGKFVEIVSILREGRTTFMDIGAGNGEKLFGALCLGFKKAYGLEYSPESYKDSQINLRNFKEETEVTCADALTVPAAYYKKAEFLYMYSPIKDDALMASLFKKVMDNMQDEAVLVEVRFVYAEALQKISPYQFPNVRGWLAVKKSAGKFYYKNIAENAYGYYLLDGREWLELRTLPTRIE